MHDLAPLSRTNSAINPNVQARLQIDDIRKTIWLTRPDIRELVGGDQDCFVWWLVIDGAKEYEALAELGGSVPEEVLNEPAHEALPQVRPTLTRFMKALWSMRSDLQQAFDLRSPEGQNGFVWWYFIQGTSELNLARFFTANQRVQLNEAVPQLPNNSFLPVTRLMMEVWRRRPDLQQAFDIQLPQGCDAFLAWYFTRGMHELNLVQTIDDLQARALLSPSPQMPKVARILPLLWSADGNLQGRFASPADEGFRRWATSNEGQDAYPILLRLKELSRHQKQDTLTVPHAPPRLLYGVNLIGYAKGQLGLGEHIRMAAQCLEKARIPFAVYNIDPGPNVCQNDDSLKQYITAELPYSINLFCVSGFETARLAAVQGTRLFDGRKSIGYWHWELSEWPSEWQHVYDLVDEVWAPTRFAYESFVRSSSKPVRHMPMAVTVDQTANLTRRHFGLPEDRFLFVFSFDFLSSIARKNPEACVEAFRRAFPRGNEPVGLVVKAMRVGMDNWLWQRLMQVAKTDGRITVLTETLERASVLDLYRSCDCFVSLHRSEGFGVGLVEAMMLGKPVIATGYSGNMDFTLPGTAALVDYRLCEVSENDYPFAAGLKWAEPDLDHAAWWMRRMVKDRDLRESLARTAQTLTVNTYAPAVIGSTYGALLNDRAVRPDTLVAI